MSHWNLYIWELKFSSDNFCPSVFFSACNLTYYSNSGYIRSPNFPSNYPNNVKCYYRIMTSNLSSRITLYFQRFNLESHSNCMYDAVKIYDGLSTSAPQLGRTEGFCGISIPPTLTSSGNSLLIVFHSDNIVTRSGFEIFYTSKSSYITPMQIFYCLKMLSVSC